MSTSPSIGLALLGSDALAPHLAALAACPAFAVVGQWGEATATAGPAPARAAAQLIADPQVRVVVLCMQGAQREYWGLQAAQAGKEILTLGLPATTYPGLQRLEHAAAAGGSGIWVAGGLGANAVRLLEPARGKVFLSLRARVPQAALVGRGGLLAEWGAYCLQILAQRHGRLDSVYARSRSLGLNRPEEDMVTAQLRFANGLEGEVSLVGLGEGSGVELEEWSRGGRESHCLAWSGAEGPGLRGVYEALAQSLASGMPRPPEFRPPLEGLRWAKWFEQSARLDREVFANEVVHG